MQCHFPGTTFEVKPFLIAIPTQLVLPVHRLRKIVSIGYIWLGLPNISYIFIPQNAGLSLSTRPNVLYSVTSVTPIRSSTENLKLSCLRPLSIIKVSPSAAKDAELWLGITSLLAVDNGVYTFTENCNVITAIGKQLAMDHHVYPV